MSITINKETNTVTMSLDDYDEFYKDSLFLSCLHNNGIDNWDWYDEAVADFNAQYDEND